MAIAQLLVIARLIMQIHEVLLMPVQHESGYVALWHRVNGVASRSDYYGHVLFYRGFLLLFPLICHRERR